jgi:hypothetical protein
MTFEAITTFLISKEITAFATVVTVLSFLVTLYVMFTINKIRKFYIFNARVPEIIEHLTDIASKISTQLNSFNGIDRTLNEILVNAEVELLSLTRKVNGSLKKQACSLVTEIRILSGRNNWKDRIQVFLQFNNNHNATGTPEESIQNIYLLLYKLTAECKSRYEDAKWEQ